MPVEICLDCGMVYYDAAVLKEVERRFFAIQRRLEEPDYYVEMPAKAVSTQGGFWDNRTSRRACAAGRCSAGSRSG